MPTTRHRATQQAVYLIVLVAVGYVGLTVSRSGDEQADERAREFDAIGDSITAGDAIGFRVDADGAVVPTDHKVQGWPGLLAGMLAPQSNGELRVNNLGKPGAEIKTILANHPRSTFTAKTASADALLLIGSNDSHPAVITPSGYGCEGSSCKGTYAGALRAVLKNLLANGAATVYVGWLPPVWGQSSREIFADPLAATATRNNLVREYNRVIAEEIAAMPGARPGPDLFSCFLSADVNRFSLFRDALHPNKLGQAYIAALWYQALREGDSDRPSGPCIPPIYLLESLDSYRFGHKQDLLEAGDTYYADEEHVLLSVPLELAAGIWIKQMNAHRDNRQDDYLVFDAGPSPVTVYIAFDPAGSPPRSTTHEFRPVELSSRLAVSDTMVGSFEFVAASDVTGKVRIGGTKSGQEPGDQQAYLVVVVP